MSQESVASLMAFINTFQENVSIIKSLGVDDLASFLLFHMGSRVLHSTTLQLFESSISRSTIPSFDELIKFVHHRCQILESLKSTIKVDRPEKSREKPLFRGKSSVPMKSVFTTTTSTSFKSTSRHCSMCNKVDHVLQQCPELENILLITVQQTQSHYFSNLLRQLKNSSVVTPPSLAQLAPFVDDRGILRVGGRLRFSALSHDAKHPILLPRTSHLTHLLIKHYHLSFLHGGPKLILSMLNHKFWILSGLAAVRQCIFSCVPCTRNKAIRPQPVMANLPSFRVQPHRPFLNVGMDYGGPFSVKEHRRRNARLTKVYLALFVCMSVKAVHLEVVSDLTTDAFLAALDRFVARRGIPTNIYSDCGTNYIGAARQLKLLFRDAKEQDRIASHLQCTWHFNPPAAPHFGGIWEAGIKSTKFHLKHVIGIQILTYEEFQTLIIRIEGILNSRPITPISSDPHDLCALTPGHFLIGQPIHALPDADIIDIQANRLNRWQLIRQCHQSYWKRWSREYLSTLQSRQKWSKSYPNIFCCRSSKSTSHRVAPSRVAEVHPGPDDIVRVVSVRTQDGTYKRPVVKLVKLPIEQ